MAITLDPAHSSLEIDGPKKGRRPEARYADETVYWTRHAAGPDETVKDSPLIFMGYGVTAPEEQWDDFAGVDVKGKTLVVMINDPGFITHDDSLFRGRAMTWYGRWVYKYEEAARRGAAAVLIIHETEPAAYGWQVVRNSNTGPKSYLDTPTHDMDRVRPRGLDHDRCRQGALREGRPRLRQAAPRRQSARFKPVEMKGLTLNAAMHSTIDHMTTRNVIGTIAGSKHPDQYFLYTAHWGPSRRETRCAGGRTRSITAPSTTPSGVAGILEIAEKFAKGERAEALPRLHRLDDGGAGPPRLRVFRRPPDRAAQPYCRRRQYRCAYARGPGARSRRRRLGRLRARGHADRGAQIAQPRHLARSRTGEGLVLSLGPAQSRAQGRADALHRQRLRPRQRRQGRRPGRARRLPHQALSSALGRVRTRRGT